NIRFSARNGLRFSVHRPSEFEGLMQTRLDAQADQESGKESGAENGERQFVLDVERWLSQVQSARLNGDDILDWVYMDDSPQREQYLQRLNVVLPSKVGTLPGQASWQGDLRIKGKAQIADFNGDGLDDLLVSNEQGSEQTLATIYLNRRGSGGDEAPVFEF